MLQNEKTEGTNMKRRELLTNSAVLGALAAFAGRPLAAFAGTSPPHIPDGNQSLPIANPLTPPDHGSIPVAFVISRNTVIIDLTGPWEVFEVAGSVASAQKGAKEDAFRLYTVAETMRPIRASGLTITPEYTFATAPVPKIIVIPQQEGVTEAMLNWIRKSSKHTDVTMSICTGAYALAKTGLLSGKSVTTHHGSYRILAIAYPDIKVVRGARWVEDGNLASSGGLTSGMDLALRTVDRYFGRAVTLKTIDQLEYQSQGWTDPSINQLFAKDPVAAPGHALCPVCHMEVDPANAPKSVYKGTTYYFMGEGHKQAFDANPEKYLNADK
jgi:putative intracellular protease/amidase/YHS domain-containing protein